MRNAHIDSLLSFWVLHATKIHLHLPLFSVMNVLLQITKGLMTTLSTKELFDPTQVQNYKAQDHFSH